MDRCGVAHQVVLATEGATAALVCARERLRTVGIVSLHVCLQIELSRKSYEPAIPISNNIDNSKT